MTIADLMWLVTLASLIGTIANIKRRRWCFAVWLVTNSIWCLYDYWIGATAQSALFLTYIALAVWGIYEWRFRPADLEGCECENGWEWRGGL